ncbi:hypothetical protein NDA11_004380 [Ustilago hordei]|uniref:Uncharacterized protein n=1 Tax=Ustilago hordei TaxID=120017 RepID=I2G6W8_USTHO|nr:uncharacterized protein UHO2_02168 [Ustilago hordei]KAJ1038924.1 hypothetical protein NDA10_000974 [Ustilago hordei]KAJ1585681.1 hypothetical protein NDA12_000619 [Ustilago hordei]KAJ1588928.1 hypothetical protein NDA15_000585 [Ustilago hordei]KAJ1590950.1 hypothetical protein NDA11_004380 [Ustilago hordei]KAJ1601024.1 hypothetical protein NDA14_006118 [Ustilago hordei]
MRAKKFDKTRPVANWKERETPFQYLFSEFRFALTFSDGLITHLLSQEASTGENELNMQRASKADLLQSHGRRVKLEAVIQHFPVAQPCLTGALVWSGLLDRLADWSEIVRSNVLRLAKPTVVSPFQCCCLDSQCPSSA